MKDKVDVERLGVQEGGKWACFCCCPTGSGVEERELGFIFKGVLFGFLNSTIPSFSSATYLERIWLATKISYQKTKKPGVPAFLISLYRRHLNKSNGPGLLFGYAKWNELQ